jgi:hypothetical protein
MAQITPLHPDDPRTLGHYRLSGRLGEGGQGVVYLGHAPDGTPVALKVLHAEWAADARIRTRFAQEVAAARRVAPFCVAQVLDADLSGPLPFIVTEFVDGPTLLESVHTGGPRSGPALHRLAVATATALAAIHEAGVVHRDFKPGNVLLGADGPRVIDFGIARTMETTTLTGDIVGTPSYMAPEQFVNQPIGPAADVFAWGCVIVFAATGESPFTGGNVAAISNRILRGEPNLGRLTGPLRELVAACLAKDETRRPGMRDILLWLLGHPEASRAPIGEALAAGRQTAASANPPITYTARLPPGTVPTRERSPLTAVAIGLAALATVVAVVAAVLVWPKIQGNGTPTPTPTGGRSVTSHTAAVEGGVTRTPRLGLEFWQGGRQDAMTFDDQGTQDVVNVTMQKTPFEFRFPKQPKDVAVQVCAWTDSTIFTLTDGGDANTSPSFKTGTGIADYEYGSGTLYLNNEGNNYLIDTRIAHQSADQDKVYFAQVFQNHVGKPLQQWTGTIYLAVWIDKNKNRQFNLTGPAEYEFVVLHF